MKSAAAAWSRGLYRPIRAFCLYKSQSLLLLTINANYGRETRFDQHGEYSSSRPDNLVPLTKKKPYKNIMLHIMNLSHELLISQKMTNKNNRSYLVTYRNQPLTTTIMVDNV